MTKYFLIFYFFLGIKNIVQGREATSEKPPSRNSLTMANTTQIGTKRKKATTGITKMTNIGAKTMINTGKMTINTEKKNHRVKKTKGIRKMTSIKRMMIIIEKTTNIGMKIIRIVKKIMTMNIKTIEN